MSQPIPVQDKRVGVFEIREGENYFCRREFKLCRGMFSEMECHILMRLFPTNQKKELTLQVF